MQPTAAQYPSAAQPTPPPAAAQYQPPMPTQPAAVQYQPAPQPIPQPMPDKTQSADKSESFFAKLTGAIKSMDNTHKTIFGVCIAVFVVIVVAIVLIAANSCSPEIAIDQLHAEVEPGPSSDISFVTFTVRVTGAKQDEPIVLRESSGAQVAIMRDDGKECDVRANDGIYTTRVEMLTERVEADTSTYYVTGGDKKTEPKKISEMPPPEPVEAPGEVVSGTFVSPADAVNRAPTFTWVVQPTIQADYIEPIYADRPLFDAAGNQDFNSINRHYQGGYMRIGRNNKEGIIGFDGSIRMSPTFDDIDIVYNDVVVFGQDSKGVCYALYPDGRIESVDDEDTAMELCGTDADYELVWAEPLGHIYDVYGEFCSEDISQYKGVSAAVYSAEVEEAMHGDSGGTYYYTSGSWPYPYVIVNNGSKVSNELYDDAGAYSDGVIPVKKGGKWGYIDANGNTVLPFEFDGCWDYTPLNYLYADAEIANKEKAYNASDNCIVVYKNRQCALYDTSGELLIDYGTYENMTPVYDGRFFAQKGGLWGVVRIER